MSWYTGNIPQAISESQTKSKLFVVYIFGDDEASKTMDSLWEDERIKAICQSSCVALKLHATSEDCKQFSAIYPVLCVPSAYFIGNNGQLIEASAALSSADELHQKVETVVQTFKSNLPKKAEASGAAMPSTSDEKQPDEKDVEGSGTAGATSEPTEVKEKRSEEEIKKKVEALQEKIQAKRQQEEEKKKELEKQKEVERRELGKNMQKLKEAQKEAAMKQELDERRRAKLEEKAARERVKRQIEQDKIDRAARYQQEKQERDEAALEKQREKEKLTAENQKQQLQEKSLHTRLQFRVPDGSTFSRQFESADTLQTAFAFVVSQNIPSIPTVDSFSLAVSFPRRIFTDSERSLTLRELGLTPSASLVVLPGRSRPNRTVANTDNSVTTQIGSFLMFILMLPVQLLQYIWSFIAGSPAPAEQSSGEHVPVASAGPSSSGEGLRRRNIGASMDVSRQGNMTRLSDVKRDDEDDDATWNGNSTQQM